MNIAEQANEQIKAWAEDKPKLVVAIDGYTGVGKTTLLRNLTRMNPDILAVERDGFIVPREIFQKKFEAATDRTRLFEREVVDQKLIEDFIKTFRTTNQPYTLRVKNEEKNSQGGTDRIEKTFDFSKKILVIEGLFLFHPELLNHLWDRRIYLQGDIEKIDQRRVAREKARWGDKYFPEDHPDSYFGNTIIALKQYQQEHHPELKADLVLHVDAQR